MIVAAINRWDGHAYCASVVESRKRITLHVDIDADDPTQQTLADAWGTDFSFTCIYEAAIWRGAMHTLRGMQRPLLVIELVRTAQRYISQGEFGGEVCALLTNEKWSVLAAESEVDSALDDRLWDDGFGVSRHMRLSFPLRRRIPALCLKPMDLEDREPFESFRKARGAGLESQKPARE